jgi:DNA repair photolyase
MVSLKRYKRGSLERPVGRFGRLLELSASGQQKIQMPHTETREVLAKSIISRNSSPDIPWSSTINPYQGCEHGCVYCYARPSHAYYDLSPGIDFETKLFAKKNAADLLRLEFLKPSYRVSTIALGTNTDAYQPAEHKFCITRSLLSTMLEFRHPVSVLTKSSLILRDLDILKELAALQLVEVHISLTTLNASLAKTMEPRAALPAARLSVIEQLAIAGVPVKVMLAPLIPGLNDAELPNLMSVARKAGARSIGYILLRLPHETKMIFSNWLMSAVPDLKAFILQSIKESRTDTLTKDFFATRMTGSGEYARDLERLFAAEFLRLGFCQQSPDQLNHRLFTTVSISGQLDLF